MQLLDPVERFYAPWVATMWLAGIVGLQWWASFCVTAEPRRPHLRLVADHGRLVGE